MFLCASSRLCRTKYAENRCQVRSAARELPTLTELEPEVMRGGLVPGPARLSSDPSHASEPF